MSIGEQYVGDDEACNPLAVLPVEEDRHAILGVPVWAQLDVVDL